MKLLILIGLILSSVSVLSSLSQLAEDKRGAFYGSSVHQARTVLFNITKKRYYNVCEVGNTSIKAREYTPPVNNTVFMADINVYPNPANDVLFIDTKDYSYIDIKLYSIMG